MKKALVLSLFVMLGVGVACSAQLQGTWDTWLKLNITGGLTLDSFYSFLDIQYLVGGWTLEAATVIDEDGLSNIWFEAYGSLGAFSAWSLAYFDPTDATFGGFENAAEVSIAGVDIYGAFVVATKDGGIGSGFALGGIGTAGDIKIGAEITWNLTSKIWGIWRYGLSYYTDWTYTDCASDMYAASWEIGWLAPIQSSCNVVFSYITAIAEFPLCCADVYAMAQFSCESGFEYFSVMAKNVNIGLDWLKLYAVGATYYIDEKVFGTAFQIVTGDVVCFKPYFTIDGANEGILESITLNALTLSCTIGGCEFYWGHILDNTWFLYSSAWWPGQSDFSYGGELTMAFAPVGLGFNYDDFYPSCSWVVVVGEDTFYPNEMFGVQCDEDSCCGGLFSFGINNFFSTEEGAPVGIFGWMGTYVELSAGIGSNVNIMFALDVTEADGVRSFGFGVKVAW